MISNKIKTAFTLFAIFIVIVAFLYWIDLRATTMNSERLEAVKSGFKFAKGLIINKHSYKGRTIRVKYKINDKDYEYDGGYDTNRNRLGVGDSILIKYSINDPKQAVTEMENEYDNIYK